MIIIKTRKEVNGYGELGRRIIELDALLASKLPEMYLKETNSFCKLGDWNFYLDSHSTSPLLEIGAFYLESEFQAIKVFIERAGNILMEVNKKLEALRSAWNGDETFEI